MLFGITGGTSPIGIYATRVLSLRGFGVRILTRRNTITDSTNIQIVNGDLRDPETLDRFLDGIDIVIHNAGEKKNMEQMWSVNYLGTIEILRAIDRSRYGIKHLCYISSAGVYGRQKINPITETAPCFPIGIYEKSKRAAELAFLKKDPTYSVSILRPTNVISPLDLGILQPIIGFSQRSLTHFLIKGR